MYSTTNNITKLSIKVKGKDITYKEVTVYKAMGKKISTQINRKVLSKEIKRKYNLIQRLHESYERLEEYILTNHGTYSNKDGVLITSPITITLTTSSENVFDTKNDIQNFIKRFKKHTGIKDLHYIYVYGAQSNRDIPHGLHAHILFFNIDYVNIDVINKCWFKGQFHITTHYDQLKTANYFKKNMKEMYLLKDEIDLGFYYKISRNLRKPTTIIIEKPTTEQIEQLNTIINEHSVKKRLNNNYNNDFCEVHIEKHKINNSDSIKQNINTVINT